MIAFLRKYWLLLAVFVAAAFLRLYNFAGVTAFSGDQGNALLVVQKTVLSGHWPLVGPFLSIPKVFIPPTNYYLLGLFLWLGKDPVSVAFFYFLANMVSLFLIYKIGSRLIDYPTGVTAALFFAISGVMVSHGRSIWEPHLVQVFLLASLFFLLISFQEGKFANLVLASIFYALATSVYPTPLLLLPYFLGQISLWYQQKQAQSWLKAVFNAVKLLFFSFLPFYVTQLYFEWQHGFMTLKTLFITGPYYWSTTPLLGMQINLVKIFKILIDNVNALFLYFSPAGGILLFSSSPTQYWLKVSGFALLFAVTVAISWFLSENLDKLQKAKYRFAWKFFRLDWLFLGFLLVIFFQSDIYGHRLWAFLPFLLLILAYCLRLALEVNHKWHLLLTLLLVGIYLLANVLSLAGWFFLQPGNEVANSRKLADYLVRDMASKRLPPELVTILTYKPGEYENYDLPPIIFFLQKEIDYSLSLNVYANDLDRQSLNIHPKPYVYLLCKDFTNYMEAVKVCRKKFLSDNPQYETTERKIWDKHFLIFVLQRQTL